MNNEVREYRMERCLDRFHLGHREHGEHLRHKPKVEIPLALIEKRERAEHRIPIRPEDPSLF